MGGLLNFCAVIVGIFAGHRMWRSFPLVHDAFHIQDTIWFTLRFMLVSAMLIFPVLCVRMLYAPLFYTSMCIYTYALCIFMYCLLIYPQKLNRFGQRLPTESLQLYVRGSWRQLVNADDALGFEAFMEFLQTEFATESLLFVVEYIQFTHLLSESKDLREIFERVVVDEDWNLSLPSNLPMSAIMMAFREKVCRTTFMIAVRSLFSRYVEIGAPLEVNIEFKLKRTMQVLLESQNEDDRVSELLRALHAAVRQVSAMMDGSFLRFNHSSIGELYYRKLLQRASATFLPHIQIAANKAYR